MSRILTANETNDLLKKYGIPVIEGRVASNAEEAVGIALNIGTPVAMKLISPDISHKSDVGGVFLDVRQEEIRTTYNKIIYNVKSSYPDARIEGILVQQMAPKGYEVIVGLKKDPQFGHVVMFGLGGIFVEVYRDVSFRIVPIDKKEAFDMISEIKGYSILKGIRGRKPASIDAIVEVLLSVSKMAEKEGIVELDINPLIVNENGAIAIDARAKIERKTLI